MFNYWLHTSEGVFEVSSHRLVIGRDRRQSGFVLPDLSVKRQHAQLIAIRGALYIEKLDPDAPTFLNRAPVYGAAEVLDGDAIDIGPWTLVVRSPNLEPRHDLDLLLIEETPSDPTIIHRVRLPDPSREVRRRRLPPPLPDDSTGSFFL